MLLHLILTGELQVMFLRFVIKANAEVQLLLPLLKVLNLRGLFHKKKYTSLCEKEIETCLVDSCTGGVQPYDVFAFAVKNGLCDASASSQFATECNLSSCPAVSHFTDWLTLVEPEPERLLTQLAIQPVVVGAEADSTIFQFYTGGIITDAGCGDVIDISLLLVGWGTDASSKTDFWIAQNSWGASWGDHGSVKIGRGKNICGVESWGWYPIV